MDIQAFKIMYDFLDRHERILKDVSESALERIASICDTPEKVHLMDDLLHRFHFIEHDIYGLMLSDIARHIATNYNAKETVIAAITIDEPADSSQRVLNDMHVPLTGAGYDCDYLMTRNRFQLIQKAKRPKAVVVDEFIGKVNT